MSNLSPEPIKLSPDLQKIKKELQVDDAILARAVEIARQEELQGREAQPAKGQASKILEEKLARVPASAVPFKADKSLVSPEMGGSAVGAANELRRKVLQRALEILQNGKKIEDPQGLVGALMEVNGLPDETE